MARHSRAAGSLTHRDKHVLSRSSAKWTKEKHRRIIGIEHIEACPVIVRQPLRDDLDDEILQNRKVAREFGMCIYFRKNLVKGILRGVLGHASIVRFTGC